MANWCYAEIIFYSTSREEIEMMQARIDRINHTTNTPYGAYRFELFANEYGLDCGEPNWLDGEVDYISPVIFNNDYYYFNVNTQTRWDLHLNLWILIIEKCYPQIKIAYFAEESGSEFFARYDETGCFFRENYYIDGYLPSNVSEDSGFYIEDSCYEDFNTLLVWINENVGINVGYNTVSKIQSTINSYLVDAYEEDDFWIQINEFKVAHPSLYP